MVGRGRALANRQGGATQVNQVDGVSDTVLLLCGSVWGWAQKGTMASVWPLEFCPGGNCPPALALVPDTSVYSCVPLLSLQLLPQSWSPEGVSLHKS